MLHLLRQFATQRGALSRAGAPSVTDVPKTSILRSAAIGAREKVREPGQDRKVATVPHASVMHPGRRVF